MAARIGRPFVRRPACVTCGRWVSFRMFTQRHRLAGNAGPAGATLGTGRPTRGRSSHRIPRQPGRSALAAMTRDRTERDRAAIGLRRSSWIRRLPESSLALTPAFLASFPPKPTPFVRPTTLDRAKDSATRPRKRGKRHPHPPSPSPPPPAPPCATGKGTQPLAQLAIGLIGQLLQSRMMKRTTALASAAGVALTLTLVLGAQAPAASRGQSSPPVGTTALILGQVVDGTTGDPIADAVVSVGYSSAGGDRRGWTLCVPQPPARRVPRSSLALRVCRWHGGPGAPWRARPRA